MTFGLTVTALRPQWTATINNGYDYNREPSPYSPQVKGFILMESRPIN